MSVLTMGVRHHDALTLSVFVMLQTSRSDTSRPGSTRPRSAMTWPSTCCPVSIRPALRHRSRRSVHDEISHHRSVNHEH